MNDSTIYISRRCPHCQELLILIHKNRDILRFRIVDIDREQFPKMVSTVPSMLIGEKILPGEELFKFLTYIINQKKGNSGSMSNDSGMNRGDMNRGDTNRGDMNRGDMNRGDMNRGDMNRGDMNRINMNRDASREDRGDKMDIGDMNRASINGEEMNNPGGSSDVGELDGFSSFGGSDLGFSLLDDNDDSNNLDMPFEFLNSSNDDRDTNKLQMSGSGNDYKSEKKTQFDNDYEQMMQSRSSIDAKNDNNQMSMRTF